ERSAGRPGVADAAILQSGQMRYQQPIAATNVILGKRADPERRIRAVIENAHAAVFCFNSLACWRVTTSRAGGIENQPAAGAINRDFSSFALKEFPGGINIV